MISTVETRDYGLLPVKRRRGEGGITTDLATRIGDNFFNKFLRFGIRSFFLQISMVHILVFRPGTMKAAVEIDTDEVLDMSAKKKTRKNYGVNPEKYQLATKISKSDFQDAEAVFKTMKEDDELEVKIEICGKSRKYIQPKFRTLEPGNHILLLKTFWTMPTGPKVLSAWFQWICDEEKDLSNVVNENLEDCLLMAQKVLILKKGASWEKKLNQVEADAEENNGNQILVNIFILRELAASFKNKPEKALFVEGEDDPKELSALPFIHVIKVNNLGENDHDEAVKLSVRIGNSVVFDDISLTQGLASVIQLMFSFNLIYPADCDDFFEYIQRVVCKFGPVSGARNARGQLKKTFTDFQCSLGALMLEANQGKVKEFRV